MAHFAKIVDGIVTEVIVVSNDDAPGDLPDSEAAGQAFIASLGLDGEYRQTSYSASFRSHYAGIGYLYDPVADEFVPPPAGECTPPAPPA